jgi:hypothetical protein
MGINVLEGYSGLQAHALCIVGNRTQVLRQPSVPSNLSNLSLPQACVAGKSLKPRRKQYLRGVAQSGCGGFAVQSSCDMREPPAGSPVQASTIYEEGVCVMAISDDKRRCSTL